jgi:hypothetical protein
MISGFTEHEIKILLFILRLSWGCGRHSAYIPRLKDFELIGVGENHVGIKLSYLIRSRVIFRDGCLYEFNKNYDDWQINRSRTFTPEGLSKLIGLNLNAQDSVLQEKDSVLPKKDSVLQKKDAVLQKMEVDLPKLEVSENGLPKKGSGNFPNREESTSQKGKFVEAGLASPKEIVNKFKRKNSNYININTGEQVEISGTSSQEAGDIWTRVLAELRSQVSAPNYRTWLEKSGGLGYCQNDFMVGVGSSIIFEYLNSHMRSLLEKTLIQVSQRRFNLRFLVVENDSS